jgi:hypothetical protein
VRAQRARIAALDGLVAAKTPYALHYDRIASFAASGGARVVGFFSSLVVFLSASGWPAPYRVQDARQAGNGQNVFKVPSPGGQQDGRLYQTNKY